MVAYNFSEIVYVPWTDLLETQRTLMQLYLLMGQTEKNKIKKLLHKICYSVQFSCSVVSYSLWPHEPQHARPPCPSPTPGVHPNPYPLSQWCHPTPSSSIVPSSSCPQSFPASGSFPVSQLFASGGQNIGVSASTSVLPVNPQDWSPFGWTCWISLQSKGLSRVTRPKKITWFASHHLALPQSSPSQ